MLDLPDRRFLVRWMFNALGLMLIFFPGFVVDSVLRADFWAGLLFRHDPNGYAYLVTAAFMYRWTTSLLCLLTAAGLKRHKGWSRPVGICTSALLLIGFPWLTIAGAIGLSELIAASSLPNPVADPAPTKPTTDFWTSKRKSKAQAAIGIILPAALIPSQLWFYAYSYRIGMPVSPFGWSWWLWLCFFLQVNVALHEAGHAIAARAVGFKLRVISLGAFTFRRGYSGFELRFDPNRLFETGGYMGAVPVSDRNLRMNQILVTAAGPWVNAITCLICVAGCIVLPGTRWQNYWYLIWLTPAGRLWLERQRILQLDEASRSCHGQAAFDKEIELKQAMLDRSLALGQVNALLSADCHQDLGSAYSTVDDWAAAEFHYRKCLEFAAEIAIVPILAPIAWSGIHLASVRRHHVAAVGPAYSSAVATLQQTKTVASWPAGPVAPFSMLAEAHVFNGAFDSALREIDAGLKRLPRNSNSVPVRAHLLRLQAMCRLRLGETDAGIAAAQSAAALLRSSAIPPTRRNLAWENIADLARK